jgi:MFS family permease
MTRQDPPTHKAGKLAVLVGGNLLMTFIVSSLMPASAAIAQHFQASGRAAFYAQIILVAPTAAKIFAAPAAGMMIGRFGRRGPLLALIATYTLAGAAGLVLEDFWPLTLSRIVIGLAGGAISTICFTLAGDYFHGAERTRALGWVGAAPSAGAVVALLLAGLLVDQGGWHAAFALYLTGLPLLVAAWFLIDEPVQPATIEARQGALPRNFPWLFLLGVAVALAAVLPGVQLPFLLAGDGIHSATVTALLITCTACAGTIAAGCYPSMRRRLSLADVLALMAALAAVAYFLLAFETGLPMIALALAVCGFPAGLMFPHMAATAMENSSELARPRALGLIFGAVFLGQFSIPFLAEPIRGALGSHQMFEALGAVLALAAIAALAVSRFRRASPARPEPRAVPASRGDRRPF